MKKRAQLPDSRTFTILFRGFANHPGYPLSLNRALSIYQSMFAVNCPVKPSIIHTNAVLNVCARAMDVDAMLGVAAKLPTRGARAPNKVTFTTIINAIRTTTFKKGEALSVDEMWESRQTAMNQGRRIWGEVRNRWQNRDIEVDEEMVCAMGRLLLLGSTDRDCDDVLSLVEQTMGIPRLVPRLENEDDEVISDRQSRSGQATESNSEPQQPGADGRTGEASKESTASRSPAGVMESEDEEDDLGNAFVAVDPQKISYVHPGRNTLSMVMDACISLKALRAAQDYWGLLTDPDGEYKIIPDAENYHVYLRLLRSKRASKLSVEMLEELRYKNLAEMNVLQPKTFRIAMSTCLRDVNNPNVLTHANKMARIMLDSLEKPDVRALGMYLDLALTDRQREWKPLIGVLRGCEIGVRNLRSFLAYGDETEMKPWQQRDYEEEVIKFVSKLDRAFQTAMALGRGLMSSEEEKFCQVQGKKMSAWVLRMRQMRRGTPEQDEGHNDDEGMMVYEEEEGENQGRSSDEDPDADVDRGKDRDDRSRWTILRDIRKAARLAKSDQVPIKDIIASENEKTGCYRTSYRPWGFNTKALTHDQRMRNRSEMARQVLQEKMNEGMW